MPTDPTADLIMSEPGLALTGLEHLLDTMPLPLDTNQLGHGDLGAGLAQGVVDPRLAASTKHDQAFLRSEATILLGLDSDPQDVGVVVPERASRCCTARLARRVPGGDATGRGTSPPDRIRHRL
jgi:hypothetical protein